MDGIYESIGIHQHDHERSLEHPPAQTSQSILLHMRPGTAEYTKLKAEADAVNQRMRELRGNAKSAGSSIQGMTSGLKKDFSQLLHLLQR